MEFCFGRLIANLHRIGRPLGRELEGWYSARVGQYRVICWIEEEARLGYVDRVDHRSAVYRRSDWVRSLPCAVSKLNIDDVVWR